MHFCNEQIRTQPLFSPPCASATYGSARVCRRKNFGTNIFSSNGALERSALDGCRLSRQLYSTERVGGIYMLGWCQHAAVQYLRQVLIQVLYVIMLVLVYQLHQPRLWFITGGYLVKHWFIPAAARARGQSNDLNREILASNLFNCHKEVINTPPVPSISRCIHIVYRHKNVWEYQWSNFIYNRMSTFLHYVHCKDALLDCSAPGGERCESLTWVDEIVVGAYCAILVAGVWLICQLFSVARRSE